MRLGPVRVVREGGEVPLFGGAVASGWSLDDGLRYETVEVDTPWWGGGALETAMIVVVEAAWTAGDAGCLGGLPRRDLELPDLMGR